MSDKEHTSEEATETTDDGRGPGRPALIDSDLFAQVWEASDNLEEVVSVFFPDVLEIEDESQRDDLFKARRLYCSMRASTLRREGVELKKFPRGRKPNKVVNVEEIVNEDKAETSDKIAAEE